MEAISKLTNTATTAIWGDNRTKEEPLNSVQGDVSQGEPYDAGNMDSDDTAKTNGHAEGLANDTAAEPKAHPVSDDTAKTSGHAEGLADDTAAEPKAQPVETLDSSTDKGDLTKAQNDTRDPENPQTNPERKETKASENVDDSTDGPDSGDNPVKIDGPGPKPIADVAKEYGGDAGKAAPSENVDVAADQDEADGEGPQSKSMGEGTGEQYVKSSGLKADGGDFDASAPGAGREADRLLEEKGMHKNEKGNISSDSVDSKSAGSAKEKVSLKDKIKAKLHKSSPS